jgi:UTP-glucose-1-phosphate uridylyltransferase
MRPYAFKGKRYDVGDLAGFLKANIELAWEDQRLQGAVRQTLDNLIVKEGGGR